MLDHPLLAMNVRLYSLPFLAVAALSMGCGGLNPGAAPPHALGYPDYDSDVMGEQLEDAENEEGPGVSFNGFKVKADACEGVDTYTSTSTLSADDLSRFLQAQGVIVEEIKARGNLFWFQFAGDDEDTKVRLRLAVLDDAKQAADELHKSLLQHGPGWWGLRRSNLSVLAPKTSLTEAMGFASKYKLHCWGVIWMAGLDDVYVVAGPYAEL